MFFEVGIIGLVEEEWLVTLATVDARDVTYHDFVDVGRRLAAELRREVHLSIDKTIMFVAIVVKSPGTRGTFVFCNERSSHSPPETMLVFGRSTFDKGKISCGCQLQVSYRRTNIVLGRWGVRVCCNDDNI